MLFIFAEKLCYGHSMKKHTRFLIMGAITGAITSPYSVEARRHAEMYYREIRHFTTDVQHIAHNTGYPERVIRKIKRYLFMDEHQLGDTMQKFDAGFEIAESWVDGHSINLILGRMICYY